jgi:sec-independent protein translocase protein TatA
MDIGVPELIIILVIVVLIFGPRRLGEVAGELGKGIRNFREGLSGKDEKGAPSDADRDSGGDQSKQ